MRAARLLGVIAAVAALAAAAPAIAQRSSSPQPAGLVDRVVAVVDGEVITEAQLARAVRAQDSEQGDPTAACSPPANADAGFDARVLECMIDELLQFQHVRRFPQFDVRREYIDDAIDRLVRRYGSRRAFEEALREQGRTMQEVRYDLEREALLASYIDSRYREIVDVSAEDIRRYYDEVLRPEMERQQAELPVIEAVDDDIAAILVETEVNRRVEEWIADLRRRAHIVVYAW